MALPTMALPDDDRRSRPGPRLHAEGPRPIAHLILQERCMSTDLQSRFQQATEDSKKLPKRPDNNTLLKLYALYKQATVGDVSGSRPGGFDMEGKMKYDAWAKQKGKAREAAMQEYIDLVESLKAKK
jgi:diazepam-binding inhibitor (GABA receptor modulator, acyl-CoA-binding protein)